MNGYDFINIEVPDLEKNVFYIMNLMGMTGDGHLCSLGSVKTLYRGLWKKYNQFSINNIPEGLYRVYEERDKNQILRVEYILVYHDEEKRKRRNIISIQKITSKYRLSDDEIEKFEFNVPENMFQLIKKENEINCIEFL